MLQGGYPRIYDTRMPLNLFFSNYIDTYIERDVSEYLDVRNLAEFRRFLTLCALSSGALINYTNIANELGVSPRTVKAWMSILESSYIAFHLMPFYTNARKQVVNFTDPNNRVLIEIKSGQTYHDRFARHLTLIGNVLGIPCEQQYVTSRVEHSYVSQGIRVTSALDWLEGRR